MVCKAFAQALAQIKALPGELSYITEDSSLIRPGHARTAKGWDSPLLLSLSPKITKIFLGDAVKPGTGELWLGSQCVSTPAQPSTAGTRTRSTASKHPAWQSHQLQLRRAAHPHVMLPACMPQAWPQVSSSAGDAGLPAFLARATQLEHLAIMCRESLEAAAADYALSAYTSSSIRGMWVGGLHSPTLYPSSLASLHIQHIMPHKHDADWLDVLMYQLARLKGLRKLRITSQLPILRSTGMQLHRLEELWLDIPVYLDRQYELQWLASQPCERLVVEVQLYSTVPEDHTGVVAQLQQLDLHKLVVVCPGEHRAGLLPPWTQMDSSRVQHWELRLQRWTNVSDDSSCLEALMHLVQVWEHVMVKEPYLKEPWVVPWASLMGRARTLHITPLMPHDQELIVTDFDLRAFDMQPPQQLVVSGGMLLHGLPAECYEAGTYTVQNKAFADDLQ